MKKDNDSKIVKVPLSRLLKRFSHFDVISEMEREYKSATPKYISPFLIDDNHYVRKAKYDIESLDKDFPSLKDNGIKNPLLVKKKNDHFEIVVGRRRLLAAKRQKVDLVPCVLLEVDEEETLAILLADSRDSNKRNVVELSIICNRLHHDFNYSQSQLALLLHQSRSQVTNLMRLSLLPDCVLEDLTLGKFSFGHAKALLVLPEDKIIELSSLIKSKHLSVRELEKIIFQYKNDLDYSVDESSINKTWNCQSNISKNRLVLTFECDEDKEQLISYLLTKK